MVAVTCGGARSWDYLEETFDLLIGGVGSPIEYQDRYVDFPE